MGRRFESVQTAYRSKIVVLFERTFFIFRRTTPSTFLLFSTRIFWQHNEIAPTLGTNMSGNPSKVEVNYYIIIISIQFPRAGSTRHLNRPMPYLRRTRSRSARHPDCSKFVVVLCSERFNSGANGSRPGRCNCLRNIVKSRIFRTSQKSLQVYESAALTAELRAPRGVTS